MEKRSVSTKRKILNAMYDLVAEVGYDKASIGKICDRVGISKPSVYYYFPSKEEIFTTLLDSMFPSIDYQRDYSLIVDRDGFKAALIELGNTVIGGYRSDEKRRRVLAEVSIQANRIPAVQERQATATNRTMGALKDILSHGVEIGALPDGTDVMLYVQILYTVLEGTSNTVAQDEDIDEKAVWAGVVGLMFK
ncbi:TetR/AcrR family transcriptional regulator [Collinsella aerofaciens]|uniref:TetR/AcrR family transcriptional regulator n=1 Tax=Collinsella aerofaciens TaxID=74426 RepID=UPI0034A34C54